MWEALQNDQIINVHLSDLYLLFRALIFFALSLVAIRIMGKRTIAQLSPFDLITLIIIGAAVAIPMEDEKIPFIHGFIPLASITIINYLLHLLILKNRKIENFLQGTPSVLVENGEVIVKNLRKERVTLADLAVLLREKNVRNINQVQEAILEPNGRLSVVLKEVEEPVTRKDLGLTPSGGLFPVLVIENGEVVYDNLAKSRISVAQLVTEIQKRGVERLQDVARATLDETGNLTVCKKGEKITHT
ncbi:MAG: YetF domain-containing protein [bacterium]